MADEDGGATVGDLLTAPEEYRICEGLSTLSLGAHEERVISEKQEKDPRKIARKYQIDLCKKALQENVIVYLGTGSGKTHIAILLIYEMGHLIKKPQKNICIFLAPTVALVQQQAKVIQDSLDFKVATYCGNSTHSKSRKDWEKELENHEIFAMTPQIMLYYLSHCYIKIEYIALLIFDECHYAQLSSNHPYAEIMKIFYTVDALKLPRIFGMTASPKLGKGGSVDGLESLLHAKVYSVEDIELENFVKCPKVNIYYYCSSSNDTFSPHHTYIRKLEEIKLQSISGLQINSLDRNLKSAKKLLQRLHSNLIFCLESLGLWGALQASYNLLRGDGLCGNDDLLEEEVISEDDKLCTKYLHVAASFLASDMGGDGIQGDLSSVEVLKEPYFSRKLLKLVGILSNFRAQPNMKCIIFVNRKVTARVLSHIIRNLKVLSSWKCGYLLGVHSGYMSRKNTTLVLEKFRSGELNLLVATKVGEEGLDIQTCCLVIRFDLPETVSSFIQSRGRARMPQSEYAFLVDSANPRENELIEHFRKDEDQMNEEISSRKSSVPIIKFEEKVYKVDSTGAKISAVSSVSLLHHYCSKLPHDEYFNPKPLFFYYEDGDGMVCNVILPSNAPLHQIIGSPHESIEAAKKDACLEACKSLHQIGVLTDYLLPESDDILNEDFDSGNRDDKARAELHEMLVPAPLRVSWKDVDNSTCFSSYSIKLYPDPADRIYRSFGLFLKEPLPEEAVKMKIDLCLDLGRIVRTEIIRSGTVMFDKDEIAAAEMFQKISLGIILDRHAFIPDHVYLESSDVCEPKTSTFYLLLPVIEHENDEISVDWKCLKKFMSSPVLKQPCSHDDEISQPENRLYLANGCKSVEDVIGSLVYVPGKDVFFFVSDLQEKNAYSLYDESKTYVDHYAESFNIRLVHAHQPLLKAKQVFILDNLLRKKKLSEKWKPKEEHFFTLPPEVCQLKIVGFSKDMGSSLSILPSIMHRLESLLVAIELKDKLIAAFPEGKEVTADRVLEAITTERCSEDFSLERLEILGDSFLKFAVSRQLFLKHGALDEGQLTRKRKKLVSNLNLQKLAIKKNLQVYIRDQSLDARQFFAFGRRCPVSCNKESEASIHSYPHENGFGAHSETRCSKCHQWLYPKTIADMVEALTGALIVDSGFKAASSFLNWVGIDVDFSCSQIEDICSSSNSFLSLSDEIDINALEDMLKYRFRHKGLLIQAFVHPSFNEHSGGCYQRLEFLGDALLDYLITSYLYSMFPNLKPGQITDLRSLFNSNNSFANIAARRSFQKFIICRSDVLRDALAKYVSIVQSSTGKEHFEEESFPKALSDLVESCMAALYLDTGFSLEHTWKTMNVLLDPISNFSKIQINSYRELTELCQSYNWDLKFSSQKGYDKFTVEAKVNEIMVSAPVTNISAKAAERIASRQLLDLLKAKGYKSKNKSLEEVFKESVKMKPVLIGCDETPYFDSVEEVCPDERSAHLSENNLSPTKVHRSRGRVFGSQRKQKFSLSASKGDSLRINQSKGCDSDVLQKTDAAFNKTLKSCLYEICAANCWKPPVFECYKETGPSHLKEFVFMAVVEIEEGKIEIIEAYGEARNRKKDAAESAAEGALWYLKYKGYT